MDDKNFFLHCQSGRDVPLLLDQRCERFGDSDFLIWEPFEGTGYRYTYKEFADATRAIAVGIASQGIKAGDHVVIHLDNCPEFLLTWFALSRLGAISVATNTRCTRNDLDYFISHTGTRAAITQPAYLAIFEGAGLDWVACTDTDAGATPAVAPVDGVMPFKDLQACDGSALPALRHDSMASHNIQFTSGTTARPKAAVWTHANALWAGRVSASHMRLTPGDCSLIYFPLFHTHAIGWSMMGTLWSGGRIVLIPKFSASRFWPIAVRNKCTWSPMPAFSRIAIRDQPDPEEHWFRFWGGGADDPYILERWGIKTIGTFGMTETLTQTIFSDFDTVSPAGCMGHPVPEYLISVRRPDGSAVEAEEIGTLWIKGVRGLSLFKEYLHDPAATAAAFDADGWFNTGDQVRFNETGHMFFVGREKDMLKVGGENVAAIEIEHVILAIPEVIECAIVGRPDAMRDEVPVAFVVTSAQPEPMRAKIAEACVQYLADFKRPTEIFFVDSLPKGIGDKVLKKQLRAQVAGDIAA